MDIKKQPKPWYIRYRYPILSGAAGIAILVYALFLIVTSGTRRVDMDSGSGYTRVSVVSLYPYCSVVIHFTLFIGKDTIGSSSFSSLLCSKSNPVILRSV